MFRRVTPIALAFALSLFCVGGTAPALAVGPDDCAGDISTTCGWIDPATDVSGTIDFFGDTDWFRFTAPQAGAWIFTSNAGGNDVYGNLYDAGGFQLAYNDDGGGNGNFRLAHILAAGQTVYVAIRPYYDYEGPYTIHAALGAVVSGTVTPNSQPTPKNPLEYEHAQVFLCEVSDDWVNSCESLRSIAPWDPPTPTWSAAVEPGSQYVVYASLSGYLDTYLGGHSGRTVHELAGVAGVTLVTGPAAGGTLTNQNITLALASSISGTVSAPVGYALTDDGYGYSGTVTAYEVVTLPGGATDLEWWGDISFGPNGQYTLTGLLPGAQYVVCANDIQSTPEGLMTACYGGWTGVSLHLDEAFLDLPDVTPVTAPSAGWTLAGKNIASNAAAYITGTVSVPGGGALPTDYWGDVAGSVSIYRVGTGGVLYEVDSISPATDGTFYAQVTPGPNYVVRADVEGYPATYYGQYSGPIPTIPTSGVTVLSGVTYGQTVSGVDITMVVGSSISGTVTPAPGIDGYGYVTACLVNAAGTGVGECLGDYLEPSGVYTVDGLVPGGGYVVSAYVYDGSIDYLTTYYGGFVGSVNLSLPHAGVTIVTAAAAGGNVAAVDITAVQPGVITGTVSPLSVVADATYGGGYGMWVDIIVYVCPVFVLNGQTYYRNYVVGGMGMAGPLALVTNGPGDVEPYCSYAAVALDGTFTFNRAIPGVDYVFFGRTPGYTDAWHGGYTADNVWSPWAEGGLMAAPLPNGPITLAHAASGQTVTGVNIVFGGSPGTFSFTSVSVSGTSQVGQVLTATPGAIVPTPTLVSYQWLRGGQPIAGATKSTYTLTTRDMCLPISVRVTVSKSGYENSSVTSSVVAGPVFTDVPSSHTFYSGICWVAQKGVTVGTGVGMYSPSDPVNRGSMAAFLYRMAGSPAWTPPATSPFTDVPKTHKFYKEITWLAASGITVGVTIGGLPYYQPDNVVNRGSMSAFMYRLSGSPTYTAPATPPFTDVPKAHTFYKTIAWLASKNITAGTMVGGQLLYQPGNAVNRGSMAAFLNRLANQHLQCAAYPNGIQCAT